MRITKQWLEEKDACEPAVTMFSRQKETDALTIMKQLHKGSHQLLTEIAEDERLQWANWLIVRLLPERKRIEYAVYAAKQVLHLFEEEYPDDERPRQAIDACEAYLRGEIGKAELRDAADAAADAADAAHAAHAAYAAYAAYAAHAADAAYAADAAAHAAYAAHAAAHAGAHAGDEYNKMLASIIEHGIELLRVAEEG